MCETNCCFQDTRAIKLLWAKYVVGVDGRCIKWNSKSTINLKGVIKFTMLKLNSLQKHVGHKKTIITTTSVAIWEFDFLKTNRHVFNECLYVSKGRDSMVQQIVASVVVGKKNLFNLHSSSICFFHNRPMTKIERLKLG